MRRIVDLFDVAAAGGFYLFHFLGEGGMIGIAAAGGDAAGGDMAISGSTNNRLSNSCNWTQG